LDAPLNT
jgi:hypothetical protein